MSTSSIPKKPRWRRSFSPAFKAEAVRLATSPGRSVRVAAIRVAARPSGWLRPGSGATAMTDRIVIARRRADAPR